MTAELMSQMLTLLKTSGVLQQHGLTMVDQQLQPQYQPQAQNLPRDTRSDCVGCLSCQEKLKAINVNGKNRNSDCTLCSNCTTYLAKFLSNAELHGNWKINARGCILEPLRKDGKKTRDLASQAYNYSKAVVDKKNDELRREGKTEGQLIKFNFHANKTNTLNYIQREINALDSFSHEGYSAAW